MSEVIPATTDPTMREDAREASILPTVARMTVGLWAANYLMVTLSGIAGDMEHQLVRAALRLGLTVFGIGLCVGMHRLIMQIPPRPFRRRALLTFALAFCAAFIHLLANNAALHWAGVATAPTRDTLGLSVIIYGFWAWFFLAWAALHLAIDYSEQVRRQSQEHARIGIAAREAQLRALRYQINPHFLFNTMNSLSTLVLDRRNAEAGHMIGRLSDFLRMALEDTSADCTTLAMELENQRLYLEIEQTRHPELAIDYDIERRLENASLPSFLLQPLVENAVKYGRRGSGQIARIRIAARALGEQLELRITNDFAAPTRTQGTGLGLANVRERLRLHYGGHFEFAAGPVGATTFEVRLAIPLALACGPA
ncbi:sensor histidine kinase [Povalibacter sp.]|uniref:sensor histidine kinase n=1 Tax=Povalibacter sp. TaxID=1962978 RepID=UPI002F403C8F